MYTRVLAKITIASLVGLVKIKLPLSHDWNLLFLCTSYTKYGFGAFGKTVLAEMRNPDLNVVMSIEIERLDGSRNRTGVAASNNLATTYV